MSKPWSIVLTVVVAVAVGLAASSLSSLHGVQDENKALRKQVYTLNDEKTGLQTQVSGLESKIEDMEWTRDGLLQKMADNKAAHKATVKELKQEIASLQGPAILGRRAKTTDLRYEFETVKGSTSWPMWDQEFSDYLKWYVVDNQPVGWGNLGDFLFPVLIDKAEDYKPGAYERYKLLAEYVQVCNPDDHDSIEVLAEVKEILN